MHFRRLRFTFFRGCGLCFGDFQGKWRSTGQASHAILFFFTQGGSLFFIFPTQRVMISPTFGWQPGVFPPTMLNPIPVYTQFV